jgi:phosphoribosyl 1,2-cyclic phosphodiesterase
MVRFTVLASGSKGNSSVITGGSTRILVDAGLSCRELFRRMKQAGEDPATLDAIVITHEHSDHVNGVSVTARKLGIPVYFTEGTHRAWVGQVSPKKQMSYTQWAEEYRRRKAEAESQAAEVLTLESCEAEEGALEAGEEESAGAEAVVKADPAALPSVRYFRPGEAFTIGDIAVSPFTIPHDAADPVGFVFTAEGTRLAVATDLGYMPPNVQAQLRRCDLIMLESNHDLEMLRDGPYPWSVKQRVLSRVGHLSNDAAAQFLEETYDGAATWVILAHLSESNNLPELARMAAERALTCKPSLLANRLLLASQHEPLEPICF